MNMQLSIAARAVLLFSSCLWSLQAPAAEVGAEDDQIATDRPDFVESSAVVGKYRFQIETSVATERNKADGVRERTFSTPTLLRYGISDTFELRAETDGRLIARTDDLGAGTRSTERGYGDLSLGVKWHAIDQAGLTPSMGVLGHVDLDSGSARFRGNGARPSLRVVAEWELPQDMSLGIMPGVLFDKNDTGRRYTAGILGVVVGKEWNERWRSFVEVAAPQIARARNGGNVVTLDVGAAYLLTKQCQLDTAISRGLNRNTADWSWTIGLSLKL
ncbi:transporter [Janthinobacterium sp. RB2R34]|uniref:transporter n=1 Tax=Janthinobacterium sp. RB2R34 TaxID=3424193 RepID=UPI003F274165